MTVYIKRAAGIWIVRLAGAHGAYHTTSAREAWLAAVTMAARP